MLVEEPHAFGSPWPGSAFCCFAPNICSVMPNCGAWAALITRRAALSSARPGYLVALERNRGCASAYLRSRALTLAMAASISPARLAWASMSNPSCRISPLFGRFGPRAGLVHLRQRFVRRCHGTEKAPTIKGRGKLAERLEVEFGSFRSASSR